MSANWVLLLLPANGNSTRKVGGLAVALRLALDAQAAGADAVINGAGDEIIARALADQRLHLPVLRESPSDKRILAIPANWLVHRSWLKTLVEQASEGSLRIDVSGVKLSGFAAWGFDPIVVTDARSATQAERLLFRSLRKVQDGWTSRWLNRYVSLFISKWLARTPFSPNQISVAILAVGLVGAYCASHGTYGSLALGAILFQMQSVLDGCDGEVSRVTFRGSKAGEWFDTIGDDLTNYSFFAAAAYGLYQTTHQTLYVIAGSLTVLCGFLASGLEYRYLIRIGSGDLLKYPLSQVTLAPAHGIGRLAPLLKRDSFVFLTMLAALFNLVSVALLIFALGAIGITLAVLKTEWRLAQKAAGGR